MLRGGNPQNFQGSLNIAIAINDIRRLGREAREKSGDLSQFDFEGNYSHYMFDYIELADYVTQFPQGSVHIQGPEKWAACLPD